MFCMLVFRLFGVGIFRMWVMVVEFVVWFLVFFLVIVMVGVMVVIMWGVGFM